MKSKKKKQDELDRILDHYVSIVEDDRLYNKVELECHKCKTFKLCMDDGSVLAEYDIDKLIELLALAEGFFYDIMQNDKQKLMNLVNKENDKE